MSVKYLKKTIVACKVDPPRPGAGVTAKGAIVSAGMPTLSMILLKGERNWRRVMTRSLSWDAPRFVRIKGKPYIVTDVAMRVCRRS